MARVFRATEAAKAELGVQAYGLSMPMLCHGREPARLMHRVFLAFSVDGRRCSPFEEQDM